MTGFVPGNEITLLRNGTEYFPALEAAIDAARIEIHLQTYIYEADSVGRSIAAALIRAAQRGVGVCLLLDGFGCKDLSRTFVDEMQQSGVNVLFYRPKISPWTLKRNRLRRLHCKMVVVDGKVAFVGGINIIDDMHTPGHTPPRYRLRGAHRGTIGRKSAGADERLWRRVAWASLKRGLSGIAVDAAAPTGMPAIAVLDWCATIIRHRHEIEDAYFEAIRVGA